jgi:hypothetical protein
MEPEKKRNPEPHGTAAGTFWTWVIAITVFILFFWITSSWLPDDEMVGKCQEELGYMGRIERVDCQP